MKKIMQFRFEGLENPNNYPEFKDKAGFDVYNTTLTAGNIFNDYKLISKIGIQGPIGLKFYLKPQQRLLNKMQLLVDEITDAEAHYLPLVLSELSDHGDDNV